MNKELLFEKGQIVMKNFSSRFALISRCRKLYIKRVWHLISFMSLISTDIAYWQCMNFPSPLADIVLYMKVTLLQCTCMYLYICWLQKITKEKSVQLKDWSVMQGKNLFMGSSADINTRWIATASSWIQIYVFCWCLKCHKIPGCRTVVYKKIDSAEFVLEVFHF